MADTYLARILKMLIEENARVSLHYGTWLVFVGKDIDDDLWELYHHSGNTSTASLHERGTLEECLATYHRDLYTD